MTKLHVTMRKLSAERDARKARINATIGGIMMVCTGIIPWIYFILIGE